MSERKQRGLKVLEVAMAENDANASTIRNYLFKLLQAVWDEGEGFSGKRPFGNSDWEYELFTALGRAGLIKATFDADGYLGEFDGDAARNLIDDAIFALATP